MSVKATYSEIMQRIMRRYLFKMDREKVERAKREDAGAQSGRTGDGGKRFRAGWAQKVGEWEQSHTIEV